MYPGRPRPFEVQKRFDASAYREVLESHAQLRPLTARQLLLLELIRQGLSNREIAGRLAVSPATIGNAIHFLKSRLGVRQRAELARIATTLRRAAPA
jgi:DNA-binding NarL/FixJ family response regulator